MNSLHKLAVAALFVATPSLSFAQGKKAAHPAPPHPTPPVVMGKSAPVRQDDRADKIADKAARTSEKAADRSARTTEKTEHSELKFAHDQKLLTKGIRLTSAEKKQMKAIEKKYDERYRELRQKEKADDKAAKKNGTAETDAAFLSQVSQLKMEERAEMRAVLTTPQQSIFDQNLTKLSNRK